MEGAATPSNTLEVDMWLKENLQDPVIWIAIVALFLLLVLTEGCSTVHWTDKGVKFLQPINDTTSLRGKLKLSPTKYRVQVTLRKTF